MHLSKVVAREVDLWHFKLIHKLKWSRINVCVVYDETPMGLGVT